MKKLIRTLVLILAIAVLTSGTFAATADFVSAAEGTTSVSQKSTVKASKKIVKLKKKSTKTYTRTVTTTKKHAAITTANTDTKKVTEQKTVKNVVKSSYKKNVKKKTVRTTTTTTVKTTVTRKATVSVSTLKSNVNANLANAFTELGFKVSVNSKISSAGVFSTSRRTIELQRADVDVYRHEMGHFLDALKNSPSKGEEFKTIYNLEKSKFTGSNKTYVTKNAQEYFAESYKDYEKNASALKSQRPETYEFIKEEVNNITSTDVDRTYDMYSWAW